MKRTTYYIHVAILLSGFFASSCSSNYLDTTPTDQTSKENVSSTVDNLYAALNGTHRAMYVQYGTQASQAGESSMNITRDMMGEDLVNPTTGNGWFINDVRWINHRNEKSSLLMYTFNYYYKLILNANLILESIDEASGEDVVLREGVKGEALCFRAFSHFQLVQLFGERYKAGVVNDQLGIPYRKKAVISNMARNTVEDVYAFIDDDLDEAIPLLKNYEPAGINHFSLKVAYGLKARIALVRGEWNEAANYADLAIQAALKSGNRLQKGSELQRGFVQAAENVEWMWASLMTKDQNIYFFSFFSFMSWNFNSSNVRTDPKCINDLLYAHLKPTDIRATWWDPTGELPGPNISFSKAKYQNRKFTVVSPSSSVGDIVYMRLAEMYLIKAEALAHAGNDPEARMVLTEYVATRDPEYATSLSGNALLQEILIQRRIELWGEGFRFTDLKRLNEALDRTGSNHNLTVSRIMQVAAGDIQWQFLIPQREIETNPDMIQNEL